MPSKEIKAALKEAADPQKAKDLQRFFKTGIGEYGAGDIFLGIRVPVLRKIASQHKDIELSEIKKLLATPVHEERFLALVLLVNKFKQAEQEEKKKVYEFYLANTRYINNWDLVDTSAPHIVGAYLNDRSKRPLYKLAESKSLWERRIAIIATFYFIRQNSFEDALKISKKLLVDAEDLIHKAVGWMLREIGNRDIRAEESFLKKHYRNMPRVMLRYAIEKFPEARREKYLKGKI